MTYFSSWHHNIYNWEKDKDSLIFPKAIVLIEPETPLFTIKGSVFGKRSELLSLRMYYQNVNI